MASDVGDILAMLIDEFDESAKAGDFDPDLDGFMANEAVPVWQGNAPSKTGQYRDSIGVTQAASGGHGRVGSTDPAASFIEYGTEDTPEHASLGRTIEHFNSGRGDK